MFEDEIFIKVKPTVGLSLFAIALIIGLLLRPSLLARALNGQVHLTEKGWRVLTVRWVFYALALAVTNELIWRTQDTDTWVAFKASLTPVSILGYIVITRLTVPKYWQKSEINS